MATSKTLTPTNVTIQIPEFTDQPDQRVNSNCIDMEADAINALNSKITTNAYSIGDAFTAETNVTTYNNDYSYAEKNNKTVLMHIYVATSLTGTAKIGTVKSGFVPAKKIFCYCYNWTAKSIHRAEIDTSGNVYVYDMVSGNNNYMLVSMYFVN